jgi:hypothetical protein
MATIILRQGAGGKGSPLTNAEIDANFSNINTEVGTKLTATDYTAADVLTKLLTVDTDAAGINATTLRSLSPATTNTVSTIVQRDASGNFSAGTITASLTGNASTATNGVVTTGSYANPSWITSLAGSKVTSIPNSSLTNSSITINGTSISLGGSLDSRATDNTWVGTQTFNDDKFVLQDNVTNSKKLNFQLSSITGTIVLSVPTANGTIATEEHVTSRINGLGTMSTQNKTAVDITGGTIIGTTVNGITVGSNASGARTVSSNQPSGGADGDIWYQVL